MDSQDLVALSKARDWPRQPLTSLKLVMLAASSVVQLGGSQEGIPQNVCAYDVHAFAFWNAAIESAVFSSSGFSCYLEDCVPK